MSFTTTTIDWTKHNFSTTKTFSLKGLECFARVVHIHDGDTLTAIIPLINDFYKFSIRLAGIDTCEMKSSNEENKTLAAKARERLIHLVKTKKEEEKDDDEKQDDIKAYLLQHVKLVYLSCQEFDKYGRVLADVKKTDTDTDTFSEILVKEKLAYRYDGKKKKLTDEEQLKMLMNFSTTSF